MRPAGAQTLKRFVATEKGETRDALIAHPLSWWIRNPLRLDTSGDLMLGSEGPDGKTITAADYQLDQKVTKLGVIAGHTILQVITDIHPGRRVIAAGFASDDGTAGEWKDLLVSDGHDRFVEIYALHFDVGGMITKSNAEIYGSGVDAVLGSYDPDTGNGGGCLDGYWWFDKEGAHEVDFSPLNDAISHAIPTHSTFVPNCWALNLRTYELNSSIQQSNPDCHACDILGEVHATYRIKRGVAEPVSVSFKTTEQ